MDEPDFQSFFDATLRPRLVAMRGLREAIRIRGFGVLAATAVGGGGGALYVGTRGEASLHPFFLALAVVGPAALLGGLSYAIFFLPMWKRYVARFKVEIVGEIVRFISPTLEYSPEGFISEEVYLGSGIFPRRPDRYRGEDRVEGVVGATRLRFSEVHSEYAVRTDKGRSWHTIFKGLFFQADFNKRFAGRTYVLTDVAQKLLGSWGQMLQFGHEGAGLVKLEDPEFETEFAVFGTDQIEARYILSPALMRRIAAFRQRTGKDVQLSFANESVFVAIPYEDDLFEPGVGIKQIRSYYDALNLIVSIVEDLNLNLRVWTKP